jgi:hypothetical protein
VAAAEEAERFFMGGGRVNTALKKICAELDEAHIPYAVAGALALNAHGYERVTVDIDLLLTREGLAAMKRRVLGRGWVEKFPGSKGIRDTDLNVGIDILLTGDYPGDGKPKPVAFPDPSIAVREPGAPPILPVPKLIELKLASGLSAAHRGKDLIDVQELVKAAGLPEDLAEDLDASVRPKYREIWALAQVHDSNSED